MALAAAIIFLLLSVATGAIGRPAVSAELSPVENNTSVDEQQSHLIVIPPVPTEFVSEVLDVEDVSTHSIVQGRLVREFPIPEPLYVTLPYANVSIMEEIVTTVKREKPVKDTKTGTVTGKTFTVNTNESFKASTAAIEAIVRQLQYDGKWPAWFSMTLGSGSNRQEWTRPEVGRCQI